MMPLKASLSGSGRLNPTSEGVASLSRHWKTSVPLTVARRDAVDGAAARHHLLVRLLDELGGEIARLGEERDAPAEELAAAPREEPLARGIDARQRAVELPRIDDVGEVVQHPLGLRLPPVEDEEALDARREHRRVLGLARQVVGLDRRVRGRDELVRVLARAEEEEAGERPEARVGDPDRLVGPDARDPDDGTAPERPRRLGIGLLEALHGAAGFLEDARDERDGLVRPDESKRPELAGLVERPGAGHAGRSFSTAGGRTVQSRPA